MTKLFTRISAIGLEMEGKWYGSRYAEIEGYHEDISLLPETFSRKNGMIGESVNTKPFTNLEDAVKFLKKNFPDECNSERCAFHIHISLKSIHYYEKLMNEHFYKHFIAAMKEWGKEFFKSESNFQDSERFFMRLSGKNKYCVPKFQPQLQINAVKKSPDRYTMLNYSYKLHKTIENRLAPQFTKQETCIEYLTTYLQCVENYLEDNCKDEPRRSYKFKVSLKKEEAKEINHLKDVIKISKFKPKPKKHPLGEIREKSTSNNLFDDIYSMPKSNLAYDDTVESVERINRKQSIPKNIDISNEDCGYVDKIVQLAKTNVVRNKARMIDSSAFDADIGIDPFKDYVPDESA